MKTTHKLSRLQALAAGALLLCAQGLLSAAEPAKSLLPAFGPAGQEFTLKAKNDKIIKGWLPTDWNDNSEWAPISATYSKLTDTPDKSVSAVRIKLESMDEGQLQLTCYKGQQKYLAGTTYHVSGWVRSPGSTGLSVGARQIGDPYEFYHEQELSTTTEWKRFDFAFKPEKEIEAIIMFVVKETGTVDLAGVTVTADAKP